MALRASRSTTNVQKLRGIMSLIIIELLRNFESMFIASAIVAMHRPSINFGPYREEITERWNLGDSQEDIRTWLQNEGLKHGYKHSFIRSIM